MVDQLPTVTGDVGAQEALPVLLFDPSGTPERIGTRTYGAALARVSVAAASAQSGAITGTEVLVHASTRCFIAAGTNPAATTNDIPLEAGEKFHMRITSGHKIAVIRDTADGFLNIVPVA